MGCKLISVTLFFPPCQWIKKRFQSLYVHYDLLTGWNVFSGKLYSDADNWQGPLGYILTSERNFTHSPITYFYSTLILLCLSVSQSVALWGKCHLLGFAKDVHTDKANYSCAEVMWQKYWRWKWKQSKCITQNKCSLQDLVWS